MTIRHGLLALLERGPMYGYQLRAEFEASTGATWPLNVGQVYTTLARLERDGLVEPAGDPDAEGRVTYRITAAGRTEVTRWFGTPVDRQGRPRDELAIKLALALTTPGVDVPGVLQTQRTATLRSMHDFTRLKAAADEAADEAWLLVLESMIFQAEAEVRWLDHCETRLGRRAARPLQPAAGIQLAADRRRTSEVAR
jgi:DNA-binding PadR family transcriptional regulator